MAEHDSTTGSDMQPRAPRRWFWLDAAAILVLAACVFAGMLFAGEPFLLAGGPLFFAVLWLAVVAVVVVLYLLGAAWNLWQRSRRRAPRVLGWRMAALVLVGGSVPLAAGTAAWIAYARMERQLQAAFTHCERLFEEMRQHNELHGSYPRSLSELPSGRALPSFEGEVEYSGGGPSLLSIRDDRNFTPLIWSFDPDTQEWTSWDPF
jgi:hypothetical protein